MIRTSIAIAAAFSALVAFVPAAASNEYVGRASVIDGDTVDVQRQRIRLHGIDAPESSQLCADAVGQAYRCGQQSALALADRIGNATVTCTHRDTDRYGRVIGVCYANGEDLNRWMVAVGQAVAYRQFSNDYAAEEDHARASRYGIWSGPFEMPWDWRRSQQNAQQAPAAGQPSAQASGPPPGCAIKGNINASGERIFHVPGGRFYDRTSIDESRGQRWFCTPDEARAAGWRPAGG